MAELRLAVLFVRRLLSALEAALLRLRRPAALAWVARRVAAAARVAAAGVAAARVGRAPLRWRRLAPLHLLPSLRLPPSPRLLPALRLTGDGPLLVLHRRLRGPLLRLRLRLLRLLRLRLSLLQLPRVHVMLHLLRLRLMRSCLQCRCLMRIARRWRLRVHVCGRAPRLRESSTRVCGEV